jgi:secreted Zn-dependent insulinase-like peptidase
MNACFEAVRYRGRVAARTAVCLLVLFSLPAWATEIIKSPNDDRSYESLVLANGLSVLLVSDPRTDKAAASLDVNVGSGSDPENRQGLAHFLEHMLFLGTEKYPRPGEYKDFINEHGGGQNAYTSFDHTNYFFDIDKDHLEPALDRFAQFFIAPLFNERYVTRERQVVHSEFLSGKKSDGRRIFSASKKALNPQHPYAKFSVGTLETLADRPSAPVRDDLIAFYRSHYSAGIMTLVVVGKEPLATLREWVTRGFSPIANTGAKPLQINVPLYDRARLPARLDIVPVKEQRRLSLVFPIPPVEQHYATKPISHIAHLLGHEGKGSLLSLLREKGWADGLSAGTGFDHESEATFSVSIKLTPQGLGHVEDIVALAFQYLNLIKEDGLKQWVFDENRSLAEIRFRFKEKPSPLAYARSLAALLHVYPPRDVLRAPYLYERFDPELVQSFLEHLTPENALVTVVAKEIETDSLTPRYETAYRLAGFEPSTVRGWSEAELDTALAIPQANLFIPENLTVKAARDASNVPLKLTERAGVELWHQQDQTFKTPRADFYISIRSPVANNTPRHGVLTRLYVAMVNDQLNEFTYPAHLAGLSYSLYRHVRGLTIRVSGYSGKQDILLRRIIDALASPKLDSQRFEILKQDMIRGLRNRRENPPYNRALDELRDLIIDPQWSDAEQLDAMQGATLEALRVFIPELRGELSVVMLSHGNVYPDDARRLAAIVSEGLLKSSRSRAVPRGRVVKLQPADRFLKEIDTDHEESASVIYLQGADRELDTRVKAALVAQILSPAFFEELRTERQLGYIVFATPMTTLEVPGIALIVQSPIAGPAALAKHMDTFVREYHSKLKDMDATEFERHKAALLTNILEEETQLQERTNRYWNELDREHYAFDLRERMAAAVRAVTLDDLESFYRDFLLSDARKQISIFAAGKKHLESESATRPLAAGESILIESPAGFKRDKSFFPP